MLERLEGIVKIACATCGVGLYDLEVITTQHGRVLCVYITKVNGVNITDCTKVSKELQKTLSTDSTLLEGQYTLEVSSPGIERPLKFKKHYLSAINELLKITYNDNDQKLTIEGKLAEVHQDFVVIETEKESVQVPFSTIKKAKTCYQKIDKENA